jgi:hypothetical protein
MVTMSGRRSFSVDDGVAHEFTLCDVPRSIAISIGSVGLPPQVVTDVLSGVG